MGDIGVKAPTHPLDPLSAEEILVAKEIVQQKAKELQLEQIYFATISNKEPPKEVYLRYEKDPSLKLSRLAFCVFNVPLKHPAVEALVDIDNKKLLSFDIIKGKKSQLLLVEFDLAADIARNDENVKQKFKDHNIPLEKMVPTPWPIAMPEAGGLIKDYDPNCRYATVFMYYRNHPNDNLYAHAMDFNLIVDIYNKKVVAFIDCKPKNGSMAKLPEKDSNYDHTLYQGEFRKDLKPLHVIQPEGTSFKVNGNEIEWQKWQFRISFNSREGLVLHNIKYLDQGSYRPILYRACISEMVVPYADAYPPYNQKCALDIGDAGVGRMADSLELGCDCLGQIHYFDYNLADHNGNPYEMPKVICLHEEDAGLSWKHVDTSDFKNIRNQSRRARRLSVSFVATVINYEYAFYWHFYQDGNIGCEIKLTGIVTTNYPALQMGEDIKNPDFGNLVMPNLNAQHHQHLFCSRLDFAIDDPEGGKNLEVVESEPQPIDAKDPREGVAGGGFVEKLTTFKTEHEAIRYADPLKGRTWKVINPKKLNQITGKPIAYKLMSPNANLILAKEGSPIYKRGFFATKNLWVTPNTEDELYPAGLHTIEMTGGQGMEEWVKGNRNLIGADPIVWNVFGITHFVRPEDFPVMPCEQVGFMLKPIGFFNENPAMDLPFEADKESQNVAQCCNGVRELHT